MNNFIHITHTRTHTQHTRARARVFFVLKYVSIHTYFLLL